MEILKIKAYAKINLSLDVVSKRPDGYHELKTVFHEISLYDVLDFKVSEEPGIRLTCSDSFLSTGEDNLVYKAVRLLFDEYGISKGLDIHIEKNIPYGAGLGGGSSDAAASLKAVNELFSLDLTTDKLETYGAKIGADVPFFISGGTAYACGIGEKLSYIKEFELPVLVLAKPKCSVSTAVAYRAVDNETDLFHPDVEKLVKDIEDENTKGIYENVGNTFEIPVFKIYPQIKEIKEAFIASGAAASAMTGSGSAVFALFEDLETAQSSAELLKEKFDDIKVFVLTWITQGKS